MNVENWPIGDVRPYGNNPRRNDEAVDKVANSIREFGWQQPIVVDSDGVVIVGHTRLKAAQKLGLQEVPVTVAEGLSENQVQAYRLADNKTGELADWDFDKLNEELESIDWLDCDMTQFGFYLDKEDGGVGYSQKMDGLFYEPSGMKPSVYSLVDVHDYHSLCEKIDGMDGLGDDERWFLKIAACRFLRFDYEQVADYYCESNATMQEAMEALKLVIVDHGGNIEDAANNFIDAMEATS